MIEIANFLNSDFKVYHQGGSCCKRYIYDDNHNIYIKEISKNTIGVDNGFNKFFYEIMHIKKSNQKEESFYPQIHFIEEDENKYLVGMEYCYNGVTLADLFRNEVVDLNYCKTSLTYVLDRLFNKFYKRKKTKPNVNYITDNYTGRIKRRMFDMHNLDIVKQFGFSSKLLKMEEKGFILNGDYYPPISDYVNYIENDKNLLSTLAILNNTESHHDLIPSNILVQYNKNNKSCIGDFKLIDPRGEDETGENNRHYMYDMGKFLLGLDTLDIFRIFNGKVSKKLYQYKHSSTFDNIDIFELSFDLNDQTMNKYYNLYNFMWEYMMENIHDTISVQSMELKLLFSQACMYHPDISCRIIDEKDEEMAVCMYLRGSMLMRKFMIHVYGKDPLNSKISTLNIWPSV